MFQKYFSKELRSEAKRRLTFGGENLGYGLCWDNVSIHGETKHQKSNARNPFIMLAMCFGAANRVNTIGLKEDDTKR